MHTEQSDGIGANDVCSSDRVLLHIGYHKTATTWFQSELFVRAELGFESLSDRNLVHRALCIPHPLAKGTNGSLRQIVSEAQRATARGSHFVISHERLSGYPASGGFDSGLIADRLKLRFPNARVLCLFREQRAMILSAWRQQVVDGGGSSLRRFIDPPEPQLRRMPLFDAAMYQYSRLLEHYRALFGADNILFLPYEAFCAQPPATLSRLAQLLGNRRLQDSAHELATSMKTPNPSLSLPVLHLQRFLNVHFARTQLSPDCMLDFGGKPIRAIARAIDRVLGRNVLRPIDGYMRRMAMERIATRFRGYFDEDNSRLESLINMPLRDLGYNVAEPEAGSLSPPSVGER
jgi:hypothetical protein